MTGVCGSFSPRRRGPDRVGQRGAGLDDHHRLLGALDLSLPPVVRNHARQDVDAGREPPLDQRAAGRLRLDSRGPSRIDEHRAFHDPSPWWPSRPCFEKRRNTSGSPSWRAPRRRPARRSSGWSSSTATSRPSKADVVVALGGDGLMLRTLRQAMKAGRPIYGMHRGTVGFLMNEFSREGPARAAAGGADHRHPSAGDARARHQGQAARALRHQRGLAVPPDLPGGAAGDLGRRQGAAAGADGRRRAGGDAGRLRPPTISRRRGRSSRSMRRCSRSRRSVRSGRGAGAARCCPTAPASPSG